MISNHRKNYPHMSSFTGKYTEKGSLVGGVLGKDCNSMYLKMTAGDMPVGAPEIFEVKGAYLVPKILPGTSFIAKEWLDHMRETVPDLETAYDKGIFPIKYGIIKSIDSKHI